MTTKTVMRWSAVALAALSALGTSNFRTSAASPKFFDDDPIWVDRDTQDASHLKMLDVDLIADLTYNLLTAKPGPAVRAMNVNTVDEVPNSAWYTNRAGQQALTAADVAKGPNTTNGPAAGRWAVTASKRDGVTPGFTIEDAHGQVWFLKFDPPGNRAMATGTEVLSTKLMWALGYHVAENHIAYLRREQLVIGEGATFTPGSGRPRAMRAGDVDDLLKRADREPNGTYRVVASKAVDGKPIGRIRFFATRPDDPNDVVPHEHRRELRGYSVFAAWLNHVDAKAINSLDMLVQENGRSVVHHYLLDFGSTLGSASVAPADPFAGDEYLLEPKQTLKQIVGFGFVYPSWHTRKLYESPVVGRLAVDNRSFDPETWKPRVPNRAFLQARADDKFWAAQRLAALTPEMIEAAIAAGDFGDPAAEAFLLQALLERRDAILRAYLPAVNPIADIALDASGVLTFRNAAVAADVAHVPSGYDATWFTFDNATGESRLLGSSSNATTTLTAPRRLPATDGSFVKIEVRVAGTGNASWNKPVDAFFRLRQGTWNLVGFNRMPGA